VRAYARVALLTYYENSMRHILTSFVAPLAPPYFSTLSHKRNDFRGGGGGGEVKKPKMRGFIEKFFQGKIIHQKFVTNVKKA
jgi:hypothetical protein